MLLEPWPYRRLPVELGAVVHGPVLLGRGIDVAVGVRCIFAHSQGLHLPLVLHARGRSADRAGAASFTGRQGRGPGFRLSAATNRRSGTVDDSQQEQSGGTGQFQLVATYWIDELPLDRRLALTVAWPEIGLPETTTELVLDDLSDVGRQVIDLI